MRGLVIEGIPGSGKTALLREMAGLVGSAGKASLWVAREHLTERWLEPLATADPERARRHLDSHLEVLGHMKRWETARFRAAGAETIFLLERFHLSVGVHVRGLREPWLRDWETRLGSCGARLLLCVLPPDRIPECSVAETIARRNQLWERYLLALGPDRAAQAAHFAAEQDRFRGMFEASALPKRIVEIRSRSLGEAAREIVDWLVG